MIKLSTKRSEKYTVIIDRTEGLRRVAVLKSSTKEKMEINLRFLLSKLRLTRLLLQQLILLRVIEPH